jgi:hypothetical protein
MVAALLEVLAFSRPGWKKRAQPFAGGAAMKTITSICVCLLLTGCINTFETRPFNPATDSGAIEGVRYYESKPFKLTYTFTALTNKDGVLIGTSASHSCTPIVQKEEITALPDYSQARVIINKPSVFSSGKFGVTLDKGVLTGVNVENSPPTAALITAVGTVAAAAVVALAPTPPAGPVCNSAPVITSIVPCQRIEECH